MKSIPPERWKWFGHAAHLCVAQDCRFHMVTAIGRYVVSSVGDYRKGLEPARQIGCERLYETHVFKRAQGSCPCGCGLPNLILSEIDSLPANDAKIATKNHMKMCKKYARTPQEPRP